MKFLIADDNPVNLKLLRAILETENHEVQEAMDGQEALEMLRKQPVDVIISDILMPRMDGYRLCQEVRQDVALRGTPVIFYTATYTSPSDEGLAHKVGADAYLRKPAAIPELMQTIRDVTSSPRSSHSPETPEETQGVMREYNEALIRKLEQKNAELEKMQEAIVKTNEELEQRVKERTAQLEAANAELEAFSHSAAHDLRTPLRAINGYCHMLIEDLAGQLGGEGMDYLGRIRDSTVRMDTLISELLKLSQVGRREIVRRPVDLSPLAREIGGELAAVYRPDTELVIEEDIMVQADEPLIRIVLENLLNNAFKFSGKEEHPRVEFGRRNGVCFVRDNGAGFDMAHAQMLFTAFQRIHSEKEFSGTGIGLAIVHRILTRHGGDIWAESEPGNGATFYFTVEQAKESV